MWNKYSFFSNTHTPPNLKKILTDQDSDPGRPHDRRRSTPLDYQGQKVSMRLLHQDPFFEPDTKSVVEEEMGWGVAFQSHSTFPYPIKLLTLRIITKWQWRKKILWAGFELATYGCLLLFQTTVHRSTNWAIEGIVQSRSKIDIPSRKLTSVWHSRINTAIWSPAISFRGA